MTGEQPVVVSQGARLSRRRLLGGAAVAWTAALWAAPAIEAMVTPAAAASAPPVTPVLVTGAVGDPLGLYVTADGTVYVADFGSNDGTAPGRILRVDPATGAVTVLLSSSSYWPSDVAVDTAGNIFFADYGWDPDDGGDQTSEGGRILLIPAAEVGTPSPTPILLASSTATTELDDPSYLLLDEVTQTLYVADTGEASGTTGADPSGTTLAYPIVTAPDGTISLGTPTVVAGTGGPVTGAALPTQPVPAGTPVSEVPLFVAFGMAVRGSTLYVADEYGHVVYAVDLPTRTLGTYAGTGKASPLAGDGDGGPATKAAVPYPQGLAVDAAGNLYILQLEGQVRRVDPAGVITTVSVGDYVSDNVGIKVDPSTGNLYYTQRPTPSFAAGLYRVVL